MVATILFLGANPSDTTHLALGREVREIDQRLLAAALREAFDLEQAWAVRTDDLQQSLLRYHPAIVHFSGHGNAAGQILVEDAHGSAVPVAPEALAGLFRILGRDIRCVVLNACYSEAQARAIVAHVDVVIGMSTAVEDWAAIAFASAFYQALAHGEDVQAAFDLGRNQIDLVRRERHARRTRDLEADESVTFSQAEIPRLLVREGLLARDVWLAKRPAADSATATIELDLHVGPDLSASVAGCPSWAPHDPFMDPNLARDLAVLRRLADAPLRTDDRGLLAASEFDTAAQLRALAERIGDALTDALLSPEARARIAAAIGAATGGPPPLLLLRVHAEDDSEAARRRADRLLALPWELLRLSGDFPVERGALDVAREAVVDDAPGLDAPDRELSVVATVAAPVNAVRLDYEGELYRLWRAIGAEERRLLLTDLGTADALVDAVRAHRPVAMHFTGHGEPGVLLFEDDAAQGTPLAVRDLVARLRGGSLPRLAFLASCYSAAVERAGGGPAQHRMVDPAVLQPDPAWSSAAELHREGIHQVIAWLGPVEDGQCTRAEETVYAALVRGRPAREAVREARQKCREPLKDAQGRATHLYTLGWAALALYHRGADVPTALPGTANGPDLVRKERERVIERLDESRGPVGVERLKFGFVGRRTARAEMIRRFRDGSRVVVVHGLGGLGKTALCAELAPALARELGARDADGKRIAVRVAALDGRFAGQQADPVRALWDQVQALGAGDGWNLKLAELQKDGITGEAVAQAVAWLAREERGLLLYLDDAESLQVPVGDGELGAWKHPGLRALWEGLVQEAGRGPLVLLASTRYVPEGVPSSACYALPVMREIDLVRMVRWWPAFGRLAAEDVAWLAERIDGHPRSLQWLDGYAREVMEKRAAPGQAFEGDLRREVLERVLPRWDAKLAEDLVLPRLIEAVGEEARGHLVRCAVLEEPAPWGAVLALEDAEGTGQRLARAGLLSAFEGARGGEPRWAPHRTVVEAAGRPSGEAAREACRRVGGWFLAEWEREQRALDVAAQAARYLCAAGDGDGAWEPARRVVLALRHGGRYREALEWVERALDAGASGERRGVALAFRGQLGRMSGALPEKAEQQLKEAVELVAPEDRSFTLAELGEFLWHQGRLHEAVEVFKSAIEVATEIKGDEHLDLAASLHSLAGVLKAQGDLAGARELLERSQRITAKVFSTDEHPDIAASLHELAGVLKAQGDLAGARQHLERSLRIMAKVFGTDEHPDVATSLHTLAGVLQAQGDLAGARQHLERSLRIMAKVFGTDEHPSVAASLHSLAGALQAQGDLAGARKLLERSLRITVKVFGTDEHPSVGASLHELAGVLKAQGDLAGARQHLERSLRIKAKVFGTDEHPDVAASLHSLAGVLQAQGDLAGARQHLERSLHIQAKVFGTDEHPDVTASLHSLAGVLHAQGDLAGARQHLERSLRIKAKVFGTDEHPSVAVSLHSLACVLKAEGDLAAAREHLEQSLRIKAKVFGTNEHPDFAASLHSLAGVLQAQGDLVGARQHLERSLRITAKVFGTDEHPDFAASLHELASVLKAQGDLAGARQHLERSLRINERIYGTRNHYLIAITEANLGSLMLASGEVERGGALLLHAYQVFLTQLGPDHPDTRQLATLLGGGEAPSTAPSAPPSAHALSPSAPCPCGSKLPFLDCHGSGE